MKTLLTILSMMLPLSWATAQTITLQRAIEMAQDSAITRYIAQNREECNKAAFERIMALRKPQLKLEANQYNYFTRQSPSRLFVYDDDYRVSSVSGTLELSQQLTGLGGELFARTQMWNSYNFAAEGTDYSDKHYVASYVPVSIGYRNTLLGYNAHNWNLKIQQARLEYAQKAYSAEIYAIAEKTAEMYMRLVTATTSYATYRHNFLVQDSLYEIGKEKFRIAEFTKVDLMTLEVSRINANNAMENYAMEMSTARSELASYLHCRESDLMDVVLPMPMAEKDLNVSELVQECLNNSSLLADYQQQLVEAKAAHSKTVRESKLNASVEFSVGYQIMNVVKTEHAAGILGGITMNVPIIDHGANKKRRKEAALNISTYEGLMAECKRQLESDVRSSVITFEDTQQILQKDRAAYDEAKELIALSQSLYRTGDITFNAYTLSLQHHDEAFIRYVSELADYWESYYHLAALIQRMP